MKHEAVTCVVCCGVSCDSEAQPQVNGVKLRCVPQTCQKSGIGYFSGSEVQYMFKINSTLYLCKVVRQTRYTKATSRVTRAL